MPDSPTLTRTRTEQVGTTAVGGEMTLLNFFTPPNLLRNDGDMVIIRAVAILAATVNNKTTKLYFGSLNVAGRGPAADNNSVHMMEAWITRRGGNTIQSTGVLWNLTSASAIVLNRDAVVFNPNVPLEIKLTGLAAVADNDIVSRLLTYMYIPAGSSFGF